MEEHNQVMRLAKPKRKGLLGLIFSRLMIVLIMFVLQILIYYAFIVWLRGYFTQFALIQGIFIFIMVTYLFNSSMDYSAKLTWLVVIAVVPLLGALLLFYSQLDVGHRAVQKLVEAEIEATKTLLPQKQEVLAKLAKDPYGTDDLCRYLNRSGCFPIYQNTEVKYFPLGDNMFPVLLEELEKAEKFIFLEFFIIDEGEMWGRVLEILARKARAGVDVRVMYDGTCEITRIPYDYDKRLRKIGIKARPFAPVRPFLSTHYNYRDHRKILVIDGKVAFNGGVNLADEYINRKMMFGHWKDTAVMLRGEAVQSFTLMFLQMWNVDEKVSDYNQCLIGAENAAVAENTDSAENAVAAENTDDAENAAVAENTDSAENAMPAEIPADGANTAKAVIAEEDTGAADIPADKPADKSEESPKGFVMPYGDCPLDGEKVGESVYMDFLYRATDYVHIMSPYLILDGEMENAIRYAAERGVDVKLILPGVPDKKLAYALAKSHYRRLVAAGVQIYEYIPGFVHAKVCVSDACRAIVGTINLDYRSLYHHFECATYLYQVPCISEIETDFENTLSRCRKVTPESIKKEKLFYKIMGGLLKIVAPLM